MGVTYADITGDGQSSIIAYSDWDRIRIYGNGGDEIWEDGDRSGGNTAYFNLARTDPGYQNQQFFPLRIRATDINRDGKPEILVARHDELTKNLLKRFSLLQQSPDRVHGMERSRALNPMENPDFQRAGPVISSSAISTMTARTS